MTKVDQVRSVCWPEAPARSASDAPKLRQPDAPLDPNVNPVACGTGLVAARVLGGMRFLDLVKAAELKAANDPNVAKAEAKRLYEAARVRFEAQGVDFEEVVTFEGHPALRIAPVRTGHLLAEPAADLEALDGFAFLYSPEKLLLHGTRGDNWRYRREVFMSHQAVEEQRLDPITIHEIEHTILSRCEEKGIPQIFTGNVEAYAGHTVSDVASKVGGYASHLSFQEISAYQIQCEMLASRMQETDRPVDLPAEVAELRDMARWGAALSGRVADVAARVVEHLRAHPGDAFFERFALTVEPKGVPKRVAGAEVVWASVINLPGVRPQVPLPHAFAYFDQLDQDGGAARRSMTALLIEHFERLRSTSEALAGRFAEVRDHAAEVAPRQPITKADATRLHALVQALRKTFTSAAVKYRADAEATMPAGGLPQAAV